MRSASLFPLSTCVHSHILTYPLKCTYSVPRLLLPHCFHWTLTAPVERADHMFSLRKCLLRWRSSSTRSTQPSLLCHACRQATANLPHQSCRAHAYNPTYPSHARAHGLRRTHAGCTAHQHADSRCSAAAPLCSPAPRTPRSWDTPNCPESCLRPWCWCWLPETTPPSSTP